MKKYLLFFCFISAYSFSQEIYEGYPENQTDYIGGNVQFYKDFHQVLIDRKMKPCENANENYSFKIVIHPDKTINYVKDEDLINLENNKCAFELSREVAKYLHGWNPAVVEGKKVAALTSFWIIPNELFGELKEGYDPANDMEPAMYEGGINNFRKKVSQNIDLTRFKFNGTFKLIITFVVERDGKINDVQLTQSSGLKEFDDMVVKGISRIKNKWTPGKIHNIPVRYRFKLPLAFSME